MIKHCPSCGSSKIERFRQGDEIIIACSKCGYKNKRQIKTTIK